MAKEVTKEDLEKELQAIQQDYTRSCSELGDLTYKVYAVSSDLEEAKKNSESMKQKMKDLNKDAQRIMKKLQALAAPTPAPEESNEQVRN